MSLLKILADVFHVTDALDHWRLSLSLIAGIAIASVTWAFISNRLTATILWLLLVAVATVIGVVWDRKPSEPPTA